MVQKKLHVLLTDGNRGLFIDTSSGLMMPNHTHWPIARAPKKTGWALAILDHVVYGLLAVLKGSVEAKGAHAKAKRHPRPFGLDKNSNFYTVRLYPDALDLLCEQQKAVWRWHHFHGAYDGPFKLKIETLSATLDKFDLMTAHCVRSMQATASEKQDEC
jgi:hypothetical protein